MVEVCFFGRELIDTLRSTLSKHHFYTKMHYTVTLKVVCNIVVCTLEWFGFGDVLIIKVSKLTKQQYIYCTLGMLEKYIKCTMASLLGATPQKMILGSYLVHIYIV